MSNGIYDLKWGQDFAARVTTQIKAEVDGIRKTRPLLPIVPGKSAYESSIQGFTVTAGATLIIQPASTLAPMKISREFIVKQEQFEDEVTASRLALSAAYDEAVAEEAIVLFGARAMPGATLPIGSSTAAGRNGGLDYKDENGTIGNQVGLLASVPQGLSPTTSLVASILLGLEQLRSASQHGPYCAIVSPDLHQEGMSPMAGSGLTNISPIMPQLRENGFQYSETLPSRTGVLFSLGKAAIDFVIPWDSHVECRKVEGDATFVVVEQFRLRINDPRAVVALVDPPTTRGKH